MPANLDIVSLQQVSRTVRVLHNGRIFQPKFGAFEPTNMWKLVAMTILLSHAVIANDENAYYLSETDENGSSEALENSRGTTLDFVTSESPIFEQDEIDHDRRQHEQSDNEAFFDYSRLKNEPKRSTHRVNLRDGTSEHRQVPAPMATLLYWPDPQDQGMRIGNRGHPLIQERRNPSFSPWGGKRDSERYKTLANIRRPVRVPFNSWGGKRNSDKVPSPLADIGNNRFVDWENKRSTAFNSWGGKRAASINFKQNYGDSDKQPYEMEDRRVSREPEHPSKMDNDFSSLAWLKNSGRAKKPEKSIDNKVGAKREPSKLIGNNEITTFGSTMGHRFPRVPFEPWGGKRRGELNFDDDDDVSHSTGSTLIFRKVERIFPLNE